MSEGIQNGLDDAVQVCRDFMKTYLAQGDIDGALDFVTEDVCGVGNGGLKTARNKNNLKRMMTEELKDLNRDAYQYRAGYFESDISDHGNDGSIVSMLLRVQGYEEGIGTVENILRQTFALRKKDSEYKICFIQISLIADPAAFDRHRLSEERFRIAFSQTNTIAFDYYSAKKKIIFTDGPKERFGFFGTVEGIPGSLLDMGVIEKENAEELMAVFAMIDRGEGTASCVAKMKLAAGTPAWGLISLTGVSIASGEGIRAVGIIEDVTMQKELEIKYEQEKRYGDEIAAHIEAIGEVNVTKDQILCGLEIWGGSRAEAQFSSCLCKAAENMVHSQDRLEFMDAFGRGTLIAKHEKGIDELYLEYRRLNAAGEFLWTACTVHLLRNPKSRDLIAFFYVTNIDERKKRELSLQYQAERDMLTELYNKQTTERLIVSCIENGTGEQVHAFMIIDLDNFKLVNDRYGHILGDSVLAQVGQGLQKLFRRTDIVGRIGGDEFVVFLKDVTAVEQCAEKAEEICAMLQGTSPELRPFAVSGTIGICLYPEHGTTFRELYRKADYALYFAKILGKNQYFFYDKSIAASSAEQTDGKENSILEKSFSSNISEYVFKILYNASDVRTAVEAVLKLLCIHFGVSRGYIFENSGDDRTCSNTYEWCDKFIEPHRSNLQNLVNEEPGSYQKHFDGSDLYVALSLDEVSAEERRILEPQGVKSMLQCAIRSNGKWKGLIGFDECKRNWGPDSGQIETIKTSAEILGTFLMKKRTEESAKQSAIILKTVMDNLDSYTYVVEPDTYRLLFINDKTMQLIPKLRIGELCYKSFRSKTAPCNDCPIQELTEDIFSKCSCEIYNETFQIWTRTTASQLYWVDGKRACLLNSVDISKYKV